MTVEERLEKVEKELARAKRRGRWLLAVTGLCTLFVLTVILELAGTPVSAHWWGNKTIWANQFILENRAGKVTAKLENTQGGPQLILNDPSGDALAILQVGYQDAVLALSNGTHPGIALKMRREGPTLTLFDDFARSRVTIDVTKEGPKIYLLDEEEKPRISQIVFKDGPVLSLIDENGRGRAMLNSDSKGPGLGLFDKDGKPIWAAPEETR